MTNCFRCAGIPPHLFGSPLTEPEAPESIDAEFVTLVETTAVSMGISDALTPQEFAAMDDNAAVSEGLGPNWENDLLAADLAAKSTATDVSDISVAEEPKIATAPLEIPNTSLDKSTQVVHSGQGDARYDPRLPQHQGHDYWCIGIIYM